MLHALRSRVNRWFAEAARLPEPPSPIAIETGRLLLRDTEERDVPALQALSNGPSGLEYHQRPDPFTEQEVWSYIYRARRQMWQEHRESYDLAVVLREEDLLIGQCQLGLLFSTQTARAADAGTLGFLVHPDYQRRGYATEAARALLRLAFAEVGLATVYGGCSPENVASRRVLEKLGMAPQGAQEDFPGSPPGCASLVFCLDRAEWLAREGDAP